MKWNARMWRNSVPQFFRFMAPVVASLGRSERRRAATHYVEGLLMPGQRKSIEPMAARLGVDAQSLQQLVSSSPWSDEALWQVLRQEVIPHLEPLEAWVVDESGWLKQGQHSVGVGHQYCGAVGKQANCQVSVEVVVSDGAVAAPIAGRLYLPQKWVEDGKRRAEVGVPAAVQFQTKPEGGSTPVGDGVYAASDAHAQSLDPSRAHPTEAHSALCRGGGSSGADPGRDWARFFSAAVEELRLESGGWADASNPTGVG